MPKSMSTGEPSGLSAPGCSSCSASARTTPKREDKAGKTNLSLADVSGEVLVVSQFTLYASCKKGNRPSFTDAGSPAEAKRLYELFVSQARKDVPRVETGEFGAMMEVSLVNDGPFTIWLDTDEL